MLIASLLTISLTTADPTLCPALLLTAPPDNTEPRLLPTVGRACAGDATASLFSPRICPFRGALAEATETGDAAASDRVAEATPPSAPHAETAPDDAGQVSEEPTAPESAPEDPDEAAASSDPAEALLRKLEQGDQDLQSFTADIFYEVEDALLGDIVRRRGDVIFKVDPVTATRSFAVAFDEVIANNRKREQQKRYVVSGRWLVEVDTEQKLFVKRELVPQGREFDPFKLGEGPIPLPVGQSADEVLRRFDVSLVELPETGPLAKLAGQVEVDGLVLIPKPGTDVAEEFERIELFYDRAVLLPVGVNVIEVNGDRETARLENLRRNPELAEEELEKLDISEPDPREWRIDIQPLND